MAEGGFVAIAIGRQLGAGGKDLGERLARRLGYTYLDHEIVHLAAQRIGTRQEDLEHWDERVCGFWERVISGLSIGPAEGIYTSLSSVPEYRDRQLFEMESRIIQETAARRDVVVIGRGAFWTLRKHPGLIRIYLHAPVDCRVQTLIDRLHIKTREEALELIGRVDREREKFVQAMTGRCATDARNYDLCIATHRIRLAEAEEMVVRLVEQTKRQLQAEGGTLRQSDVAADEWCQTS